MDMSKTKQNNSKDVNEGIIRTERINANWKGQQQTERRIRSLEELIGEAYAHRHDLEVLSVKPIEGMEYFRIEYFSESQNRPDVIVINAKTALIALHNYIAFKDAMHVAKTLEKEIEA